MNRAPIAVICAVAACLALAQPAPYVPDAKELAQSYQRADELRGMPVTAGDRILGRVTSAGRSPALERSIGLAWIRTDDGEPPADALRAGDASARLVPTPFYDPRGARLRG